jgi:hypothetical protein
MSSASTSAVRRAKAFFEPSGRIRVLILTQLTSYCFLSAAAIWRLLALTSTMKTSVLFSSIYAGLAYGCMTSIVCRTFFMADSVLSGWMRTVEASMRGAWGTDLRGYLGARDSSRVLGLWHVSRRHANTQSRNIPTEGGALPDGPLLVRVRLSSR